MECVQAHADILRAEAARSGPSDLGQARLEKERLEIRRRRIEVAKAEGLVVNLDDHRSVLAKVLDATRAALLAIPGSWGPRVVGIMSPAEATETMVVCSEELLRDLAAVADELEAAGLAPADRLPPEFPGLRALTAAGIETFSDLRSLEDEARSKGSVPSWPDGSGNLPRDRRCGVEGSSVWDRGRRDARQAASAGAYDHF